MISPFPSESPLVTSHCVSDTQSGHRAYSRTYTGSPLVFRCRGLPICAKQTSYIESSALWPAGYVAADSRRSAWPLRHGPGPALYKCHESAAPQLSHGVPTGSRRRPQRLVLASHGGPAGRAAVQAGRAGSESGAARSTPERIVLHVHPLNVPGLLSLTGRFRLVET
jgi:hypothetical protein